MVGTFDASTVRTSPKQERLATVKNY